MLNKMAYSLDDVADQSGKTILITGASSGIGLAATRLLVSKGAHVVMGCRNLEKSAPLASEINKDGPGKATLIRMDTTDFDSIDQFVRSLRDQSIDNIDVLVLNAGIMMVEYKEIASRSTVNPKIESQMACNVVGHFYLTFKLLPLLRSARIISVSSILARVTKRSSSINYNSFLCNSPASYGKIASYCESKLGNLLFVHELNKRLKDSGTMAYGAHPGYSRTALQTNATSYLLDLSLVLFKRLSMPPEGGGLVLVMAATLPQERIPEKNAYFGPSGLLGLYGPPSANCTIPPQATDDVQSLKLWETCEELCGLKSEIYMHEQPCVPHGGGKAAPTSLVIKPL